MRRSNSSVQPPRLVRQRLRVLLVPDSIHWITGTIAQSIVAHNGWIDGTIVSGSVLEIIAHEQANFFDSFDLVHFVCPYASKRWLPFLRDRVPCVTSHHHVSDAWELQQHNLDGDAIVVGSLQWVSDAIERGAARERLVCIPYGVDSSRFVPAAPHLRSAARQSLGIASDAIVIGFFAKLSSNEQDRKGTDIFSAAVQSLIRDLPNLVVLIIGPGWDTLVAQLRAAGVSCVWHPFVRDADRMPLMYQALDFYWVTARVEGGPVTLLEAMSTELCCVSTPVGLANEVLEDGENGLLVPFDDVRAFAQVTLQYANNPTARATMGARARQTIVAIMDVRVTARGVEKAYDVAVAHFNARIAIAGDAASTRGAKRSNDGGRIASQAQAIVDRVALLEQLVWAEALILQGQRSLAFRIIAETWVRHPFSTLAPRFLFRNVLPQKLVRTLVRAKLRLSGSP
jgi:glycosyltransferase involved in cell wall biosynthesis